MGSLDGHGDLLNKDLHATTRSKLHLVRLIATVLYEDLHTTTKGSSSKQLFYLLEHGPGVTVAHA